MCAWLDELQHGHHRSGEVYFPNGDSDERAPYFAHFSYTWIPLLWPICTEYTLGPLLWAVRREWLRRARSDTNPTHLPPSVVAHRATTLTYLRRCELVHNSEIFYLATI
jgi:hypothetical protein